MVDKRQQYGPVIFRGGGDIATGSIYMLYKAGFPVVILETANPSAIRREVAFCEAVYQGDQTVEDVTCQRAENWKEAREMALSGELPILVDPDCACLSDYTPHVLVDGILAKRNMGTTREMADVTIGLGPGFTAGEDVDFVVETMRGHDLGRVFTEGTAVPNTGIPGIIAGVGKERVIHSPAAGRFSGLHKIADIVEKGELIGKIITEEGDVDVPASLTGVLRGIIRDDYPVTKGFKIADIDPRKEEVKNCFTISDKARCIGGTVLLLVCEAYR